MMANKQRSFPPMHIAAPSLGRLKFMGKVRRAAPAHLAPGHFDVAKTCKNQCADNPLRPEGASERQFALSCPPRPPRPPRSLVSSGQFPSCRLPRTRSDLRQDALPVIAISPHMIDARSSQRRALSARKPDRELTDELQPFSTANADRGLVTVPRHAQQTVELPAKGPHV